MPRANQEQPENAPFEYRAGVTMPNIGGMYRRGDAAQIPPNRLHLGVNIRLADNEAGSRPGLTPVEGTQEDACITGIFEIDDLAVGIYIANACKAALDAGDPLPDTPFRIMSFNEEKDPPELNYWDADATFPKVEASPWRSGGHELDAFNSFQRMGDRLLILNGLSVYEAQFSEDDGLPRLDLTHLVTLPASAAGPIRSSCVRSERVDDAQTGDELDKDVLYLGGTDGEIWRYDGTTIELVKTLANGGWMQVMTWNGTGLVAAGDSAGGFTYQEQKGFAWVDQAWGQDFNCNGLCEFNGQVVFVGDFIGGDGKYDAYALRWPGSGAPVLFASDLGTPTTSYRYRTPVVAQGALHWLRFYVEGTELPDNSASWISRYESFGVGDLEWCDLSSSAGTDAGFFLNYRGALLLWAPISTTTPLYPANSQNVLLVSSGGSPNVDVVYTWAQFAPADYLVQPGEAHEAVAI